MILQQWDFANHNFMERMHTALESCARVIALLKIVPNRRCYELPLMLANPTCPVSGSSKIVSDNSMNSIFPGEKSPVGL